LKKERLRQCGYRDWTVALGDSYGRIDQSEYFGSIVLNSLEETPKSQRLVVGGQVLVFGEVAEYRLVGFRKSLTGISKNVMMLLQNEASTSQQIHSVPVKELTEVRVADAGWSDEKRKSIFNAEKVSSDEKKEQQKRIKVEGFKREREEEGTSLVKSKRHHGEPSSESIEKLKVDLIEIINKMGVQITSLETKLEAAIKASTIAHQVLADNYHQLLKESFLSNIKKG
jgi:hypothetical protein